MDPDRIERAARALMSDWGTIDAPTEAEVEYANGRAREILAAAYPELASGSHWVAPMEATEGMEEAAFRLDRQCILDETVSGEAHYRAMRDAYLSQPDKDET